MLPGEPAIVRPMSGGPQPHMIPIVPGDPGLTGRTPLAERVERHMADKGDPHGTMAMVNEAIRGFIRNEADPLFSDWLAKHNVVEVETDPVFTEWVNRSNVRLGEGSSATSATAIALGCNAKCSADGSVQLGDGTNLTRTSLQFRNANLFVQGSGSVAALGTGFPRASASAYGAVKIGSGLSVSDGVVSSSGQANVVEKVKVNGRPLAVAADKSVDIAVPDSYTKTETDTMFAERVHADYIEDDAGNKIAADGSAVVVDGSWTCNGVVLTKKDGRDYWENAERGWGLGYDSSAKWAFTNGSGYARLDAPADATKLSFVIGEVTYDATIGRADSVVMAGDVVPMGDGTETIATIGGKDIKAPASPVSSVNGKKGEVKLGAQDVGALALESANKVGSSFSMGFEGEETSGGNILFGVGSGPAGWTFIVNKLYCSDNLFANGFVITNTSGAPGESVLNRIQEYGGDFKTALDEVNGLVETAKRYSVVRPEASGNTYQLSDFAVNVVDLPSSGEYTFTFPPRTGGRVRDFVLKLNVTADPLPTVQFVKHPTDSDPPRFEGADGWSELELGVNFFGFTETS